MSSAVIYPPGRGAGALEASPGWRHRRPPGRSRGLERPWLVRRVGRPRQIRGVRGFGPCPGHYVNGHMAPPKKLFGKSIKSVGHLGQVGSGGRSGGCGHLRALVRSWHLGALWKHGHFRGCMGRRSEQLGRYVEVIGLGWAGEIQRFLTGGKRTRSICSRKSSTYRSNLRSACRKPHSTSSAKVILL